MKKKIFYWSPFFSNIATTKAVINSAISVKKFSKEKFEPSIVDVFGEWDDYIQILNKHDIKIEKLQLDKFFKEKKIKGYLKSRYYQIKIFILAFFPLLKLIRNEKPEIFILHLVTSLPLLINYLFKFNHKMVLRISGLPKLNFVRKLYWKLILKKVDIVTTPTNATKSHFEKIFNHNEIRLLRDPIIFVDQIKLKKKITRFDKTKFVAIGRLTKQKNFLFLVECFCEIIKIQPDTFLHILGEGEDRSKIEDFIYRNNLEKNIFLEGYKSNIFEYLQNCDGFILSSLWEDPGFVLVEAAYSNTTIISSNCHNGPTEILDNGNNGFLYTVNNKDDFLKKFSIYKNTSQENLIQMKINAKKMSKNYSLFSHYSKLKELLI